MNFIGEKRVNWKSNLVVDKNDKRRKELFHELKRIRIAIKKTHSVEEYDKLNEEKIKLMAELATI